MAKQKLNLSMDAEIVEGMKLQAVLEKRSVSAILEELCSVYLRRFEDFRKTAEKRPKK